MQFRNLFDRSQSPASSRNYKGEVLRGTDKKELVNNKAPKRERKTTINTTSGPQ